MLAFKDFAPEVTRPGWFGRRTQSLDDVLAAANAWIADHGVVPVRIETVVLPDLWSPQHGPGSGSRSPVYWVIGATHWYQVFRVWYDTDAVRSAP